MLQLKTAIFFFYIFISLDNTDILQFLFTTNDSLDVYKQIPAYYISLFSHFKDKFVRIQNTEGLMYQFCSGAPLNFNLFISMKI